MKMSDAPRGTIATLGHPANGRLVVKGADGYWRSVDTGATVDPEDFRAGWDVVSIPTVKPMRMTEALEQAEAWAEHGYTENSKSYWSGMRDTLRVVLGITTERPTMTGPGADVAASVML